MSAIEIQLAIEIEERARGTVCYFGRPPPRSAKKPDQVAVIHPITAGCVTIEIFSTSRGRSPDHLEDDLKGFFQSKPLRIEPVANTGPIRTYRILAGQSTRLLSTLHGFKGVAFALHIQD